MARRREDVPSTTPLLTKVLGTAGLWSILGVVGWRLRHPMVELALVGIGVAVTILIWVSSEKD
jgi:hypothetical protein